MVIKFLLCLAALGAATFPCTSLAADTTTNGSKKNDALTGLFEDKVVAKTKTGIEIKRSQLDEEVIRLKANLAGAGKTIPPEQLAMLEPSVLDQIISLKILQAKATPADKAKGKELAEKRLDLIKTQLGSDDALNMRLRGENITRDQLLERWTQQATAEAVVKRELNVNITDDQVKKYLDENPAKFEQPEMVRASHILFSTRDNTTQKELSEPEKATKRKKAEDVLKRARAGEDFAALAKENTDDPGSKDKGGEYTFPRGRMVPEFEAAAFSLTPGQVSDLVTTQFGYHIIKLSEKIPAKKVELAKVAPDVKEALAGQEVQKGLAAYMKKVKADAGLQILDEKLVLPEPPADSPATAAPNTAGSKASAKK